MASLLDQYREAFPQFREMKDADIIDNLWNEVGGDKAGIDKQDFALSLLGKGPKMGSFEAAKERLKGSLETGTAKILDDLGAEGMASRLEKRAADRREDVDARYQPRLQSYEDIQSIGDVPEYIGQLAASSAPQMGLQAVGGLAALALTRGKAVGPLSAGSVATVGAGVTGFPAYFGSNIERQMEEGKSFKETETAPAAAAAVGQSALDAMSLNVLFKGIPGVTAAEKLGRLGRAATRAVEGGLSEALTEGAQQALEIIQANPEKFFEFGPKVQKEVIEAMVGGGLLGGTFGGVAGAVSRGPKKPGGVEAPRPESPRGAEEPEGEQPKEEPLALPPPEKQEPEGQLPPEGEPQVPAPKVPEPGVEPGPVDPGTDPTTKPEPVDPIEPGKPVEPVDPNVEPVAKPEPVVEPKPEPVVEPEKPTAPIGAGGIFDVPNPPSLPKPLQLGKPKFDQFYLNFERDVDRALFHASKKSLNEKDQQYVKWLKDQGLSDREITAYGQQYREMLREAYRAKIKGGQKSGPWIPPRFTMKLVPPDFPAQPAPVQPAPAPAPAPVVPAPKPAPVQPAPAPVPPPTAKPSPAPAPTAPTQPGAIPFSKQVSKRNDYEGPVKHELVTAAPGQDPSTISIRPRHRIELEDALPGGLDMIREIAARLLPGVKIELRTENDPYSTTYGWNRVDGVDRITMAFNPTRIADATKDSVTPDARQAFLARTIFHELSHNVENFYLIHAPKDVFNAVVDQYVKERNPGVIQRLAIYDALKRMRPQENPKFYSHMLMKFNITEKEYKEYLNSKTKRVPTRFHGKSTADDHIDLRMDYYRSFTEWVAEKGADWFVKEAKGLVPKTVFQKFQKDILDLLRNLYEEVRKAIGLKSRAGAFEQFMKENYGKRRAVYGNPIRAKDSRIIDYANLGADRQSTKSAASPSETVQENSDNSTASTARQAPPDVDLAQQKLAGIYTAPEKMGFKGFMQAIKDAYQSGSYKDFGDKLTRAVSDRFIDLRRLDERFAQHLKATGRKVQEAYDQRYAIAANLSSYAGILSRENVLGMLETTLKYGGVPIIKKMSNSDLDGVLMISRDNNKVGLNFLADLVRKDKLDAFKYYAMAQRVLGRYADKKAPITHAEAQSIVAHYGQDPDVVSAYKAYQDFNKSMMKMAVDAGVISQDMADEFMKHNDYYPFYREMDETGKYTGPLFTQGVLTRTKIQQAIGGTEKLEADPIEVIMKNAQFWMHSAAKNLASKKITTMMQELGEAREINHSSKLMPGESLGIVRDGGKEKLYAIANPDIAAALETTGAHQLPNWTGVPGKFTQFYRELVTRSPDFILKNLIRDPLNAYVISGVDMNPFAAINNFRKALTDPQSSKELMALQNYGIIGGFRTIPGIEDASKLLDTNFSPTSNGIYVVPSGNVLTSILSKAWNGLGRASEASDAATRMEIYKRVLEATGNEAEAAFRAQEVINFRKQGSSTAIRYLSILVPFINGRIQGLDTTARAFTTDFKNTMIKGALLTAVSMGMQALMGDDEEYKQLPDYVRYGTMPVPLKLLGLGDSGFLAIPKPFEIGFIFQTFPEVLVQAAMGNTENRAIKAAAWEQIKNTFGLAMAPQIVAPIFEVMLNRSSLTGLPIVTDAMKNLPAELQYSSSTSDIVKNLAGAAGISPVQAEALIKGYGGQIVTSLLGLIDGMYRTATGTGVNKDWTQYPTVSTFLKTQQNTNPKGAADVYRLSAEIQGLTTAVNTFIGQGMADKARGLIEDNRDLIAMKQAISGLRTQLNTLSRNERMIVNNPNIPQDQKNEQMERIREARRSIGKAMTGVIEKTGK